LQIQYLDIDCKYCIYSVVTMYYVHQNLKTSFISKSEGLKAPLWNDCCRVCVRSMHMISMHTVIQHTYVTLHIHYTTWRDITLHYTRVTRLHTMHTLHTLHTIHTFRYIHYIHTYILLSQFSLRAILWIEVSNGEAESDAEARWTFEGKSDRRNDAIRWRVIQKIPGIIDLR